MRQSITGTVLAGVVALTLACAAITTCRSTSPSAVTRAQDAGRIDEAEAIVERYRHYTPPAPPAMPEQRPANVTLVLIQQDINAYPGRTAVERRFRAMEAANRINTQIQADLRR